MDVRRHGTAEDFLRVAGPFLETEEAVNSLILGLAASAAAGTSPYASPPVMLTVTKGPSVLAAMLMTIPPRYALLYAPGHSPGRALGLLADALWASGEEVCGCMAPVETAWPFAELWAARSGRAAVLQKSLRIYDLHRVRPPAPVPGRLRPATMDELDLAADWRHRFQLETLGNSDAAEARSTAERNLRAGHLFFWEDAGRPACQAGVLYPTRRGICIGAVFTPPDRRRRGYASACVAATSQEQLDAGRRFCCLYTDLANPTTNRIYQEIGYVPVAGVSRYRFGAADNKR
jgi:uncharacterized protein